MKLGVRAWTLRLGIGALVAGAWVMIAPWPGDDAGLLRSRRDPRTDASIVALAQLDMDLRAAGLHRYAAVHQRLPATLAECGSLCPSLQTVAPQLASHKTFRWYFVGLGEPWLQRGQALFEGPPPDLDLFGLPLRYDRCAARPGETRCAPYHPLSGGAMVLMNAMGTPVTAVSADPFTLSSPFLEESHRLARRESWTGAAMGLALVLLSIGFCAALVWWVWRARRQADGGYVVATAASTIMAAALFAAAFRGAAMTTASNVQLRITSDQISRAQRLEMLDRAAKGDALTPEVVNAARRYIGGLSIP